MLGGLCWAVRIKFRFVLGFVFERRVCGLVNGVSCVFVGFTAQSVFPRSAAPRKYFRSRCLVFSEESCFSLRDRESLNKTDCATRNSDHLMSDPENLPSSESSGAKVVGKKWSPLSPFRHLMRPRGVACSFLLTQIFFLKRNIRAVLRSTKVPQQSIVPRNPERRPRPTPRV